MQKYRMSLLLVGGVVPAHVIYVLRFPCRQWTCGNTIYRVLYGRWLPVNYYAIYSPCTLPPRVYGYPFKAL